MTGLEGVQSIPSSTLFRTYTTPRKEDKSFSSLYHLYLGDTSLIDLR